MHPLYEQAAGMTRDVIGAAIEVHKDRGPGLLASVYQWCFCKELGLRGYSVETQRSVVVRYKGFEREDRLKRDVLVNSLLLVEVKAVEKVHPIHKAQVLSYMKLLDILLGLLINFNVERLTEGVSRLILPGANQPN